MNIDTKENYTAFASHNRSKSSIVILNYSIFITGGYLKNMLSNNVEIVDMIDHQFNYSIKMPLPMGYNNTIIANNQLFLFDVDHLFLLDLTRKCWSEIPNILNSRMSSLMINLNNNIYMFGGDTSLSIYIDPHSAICFDTVNRKITIIADTLDYFKYCQAVILNEDKQIIAILGASLETRRNSIQIYNVCSNTWTIAKWKMPALMEQFAAQVIQEYQELFIISDRGCWKRSIVKYDTDDEIWINMIDIENVFGLHGIKLDDDDDKNNNEDDDDENNNEDDDDENNNENDDDDDDDDDDDNNDDEVDEDEEYEINNDLINDKDDGEFDKIINEIFKYYAYKHLAFRI